MFGDVSPSHRERFEVGAFDVSGSETRWLDWDHDPSRVLAFTNGGGLELRADASGVHVEADLPMIPLADRALDAVKDRKLTGFSVEFHARAERRESGLRVIEKADLIGVGLVRVPSYSQSVAETRGAELAIELGNWIGSDPARLAAIAAAAGMTPDDVRKLIDLIGRELPETPGAGVWNKYSNMAHVLT